MPATNKPPTVPCEPIEATAILEIIDNCSWVIPCWFGIRHIGESTSVLTGDRIF